MRLHRHRWTLVGAQRGQYRFGGGDVTTALYKCGRCDKLRTVAVDGHWTLAGLVEK